VAESDVLVVGGAELDGSDDVDPVVVEEVVPVG
jgi:hypothetical protein